MSNFLQSPTEKLYKKDQRKITLILLFCGLAVVFYHIIQDFLVAQRESYDFHLSESLLFKTIWILFIPFLLLMRLLANNLTSFFSINYIAFILASSLLYIGFSSFISTVISAIYFQSNYSFYKFISYSFYHDFLLIISLYSIFLLGYNYLKEIPKAGSRTDSSTERTERTYLSQIRVHTGKEFVLIQTKDIYYFSTEKPYINIHLNNRTFLHVDTLYSMEKKLDPSSFLRVHKSYLVNLTMVVSFRSRSNGDYDLTLRNGEVIRLSRTYAAAFKTRLG